jgi:hypothetical protein
MPEAGTNRGAWWVARSLVAHALQCLPHAGVNGVEAFDRRSVVWVLHYKSVLQKSRGWVIVDEGRAAE